MGKISLKAARVNAELTQQDVANALDVSKETVKNWEYGDTAVSLENGFRLAKLYGCTIDDIDFLRHRNTENA